MGAGMAKFAVDQKVVTLADYNEYCHYVAGLVGIGLSRMWACSGLECKRVTMDPSFSLSKETQIDI